MNNGMERGRELYELGLRLGGLGTVAIGSGGGELARALARSVGCGVALAGGEARFHDGSCAACGAWLGRYYGLPASVFVRQTGEDAKLFLLDGQGRPFQPEKVPAGGSPGVGEWDLLAGADCAWAANRVAARRRQGVAAARGPAALTLALERLGYDVMEQPVPGAPLFQSDPEGFQLRVEWNGAVFYPEGEDALDAAAGFVPRPQAIPAFRPGREGGSQT